MLRRLFSGCNNVRKNFRGTFRQDSSNDVAMRNFKYYSDTANSDNKTPVMSNDRQLKIIKTEMAILREGDFSVPDEDDLLPHEWDQLQRMSNSKRRGFYEFLFRKYNSVRNEKMKRAIRKEMLEVNRRESYERCVENKHIVYGLGKSTLLMKVYPRTVDRWRNHKIFRSLMRENSQLIFDCGFEDEMTPSEINNTAKQLVFSFGVNRLHSNPFFFHFTNLNYGGRLYQSLLKAIPTIVKPTFPIKLWNSEFPKDVSKQRLVYLSPDSHNDLLEFNPNDVYVIGALVEKGAKQPLTLAKSKEQGFRTARLPLDRFLRWKQSTKDLTIDQVTKILLDLKTSGKYQHALKHVPSRKLQ